MGREPLTVLVVVGLVVYALYIGAYIPPMLVGTPPVLVLIGFLAQVVAALLGAAGTWWRQPWAPHAIVGLGVAIAATAIVEGFVLGLIALNHALAVAVLALAIAFVIAVYVSRSAASVRS
jgi:hypothetical protein